MKFIILFLLPNLCLAGNPIAFQARIQSEGLAEEAIDFLHCVSESTELSWELSEAKSPNQILLQEKGGELVGFLKIENQEKPLQIKAGEAQFICENLFPPKIAKPEIPVIFDQPIASSKTWVTAGVLTLAVGLGIFLWKNQQPDHRGIQMN
jgi:hypothetical protein